MLHSTSRIMTSPSSVPAAARLLSQHQATELLHIIYNYVFGFLTWVYISLQFDGLCTDPRLVALFDKKSNFVITAAGQNTFLRPIYRIDISLMLSLNISLKFIFSIVLFPNSQAEISIKYRVDNGLTYQLSLPTEAIRFPSGLQSTAQTVSVWPTIVWMQSHSESISL